MKPQKDYDGLITEVEYFQRTVAVGWMARRAGRGASNGKTAFYDEPPITLPNLPLD